jgi:hypothetical protein
MEQDPRRKETKKLSTEELEEMRKEKALDEVQEQAEERMRKRTSNLRRKLSKEAAAFTLDELGLELA